MGVLLLLVLTYPSIRHWRAEKLVESARELADKGDVEVAWERAKAASVLAPKDLAIKREVALIGEKIDPRQAAELWADILEAHLGEAEAMEGVIRSLLKLREERRVAENLALYRDRFGENRFWIRSSARYWQILNRPVMAAEEAWKLLLLDDVTNADRWLAIEIGLDSPKKQDNDRSRELLRQLALEGEPEAARKALRRFCELPRLTPGERDFAIRRWAVLALSDDDHLLALELRLEEELAQRETIAEEAKRYFDLSEGSELVRLGRWYNWQGLYAATLDLISEEAALGRNDLFLIRLDALALVKDWESVRSLLDKSRIPLQRYAEEVFRMRSFLELGDQTRAAIAWNHALQAARGDAQQLRFLARYTDRLDLWAYSEEALWALSEAPGYKRMSYLAIIGFHERRKETRQVRQALTAMRRDFPHDYAVANDWAYYSLLLRSRVDEAKTLTEELIALNPNQLSHRMNHVLGLVQDDRFTEAMSYLETLIVPNWFAIESSRWKALVAVVLWRVGRQDDASRLLRTVNLDRLMPEELFLVKATEAL